ncbi:MAG: NADH-dependent oxidoreductase, partial [Planctomycetaceae bacterium]
VGWGYSYAGAGSNSKLTWKFNAPSTGKFDIRISHQPHENRSTKVRVSVDIDSDESVTVLNMRKAAPLENGFSSLGIYSLEKGESVAVIISTTGSDGNVHADALQVVPVK